MAKDKGSRTVIDNAADEVAIRVENVSKSFRLPHNRQSSLKGSLVNLISGGDRSYETQEVLKNISFDIKKGEFFGIVGRNGSGKSTLLKMLAGIYKPTAGKITVNGSLTPFIELGVGFNPELTGRENVYMNGALLGFNDKEVDEMYDDIVSFAELERFMDQKLKNYSSGMQVRLAFSVAIRARGDVLVLDEVLAVGDEAFQRKCYNYFETLKRKGKTVVLVTHDMSAVERFCTRAMFVEDGNIVLIGRPLDVSAAYSRSNDDSYVVEEKKEEETEKSPKESGIKITLFNDSNQETNKFVSGQTLNVRLRWNNTLVKNAGVSVIRENGDYIFGQNTCDDPFDYKGRQTITMSVKLNVAEGEYFIIAGLFGKTEKNRIAYEESGPKFLVSRNKDDVRWGGTTKLDYHWTQESRGQ